MVIKYSQLNVRCVTIVIYWRFISNRCIYSCILFKDIKKYKNDTQNTKNKPVIYLINGNDSTSKEKTI